MGRKLVAIGLPLLHLIQRRMQQRPRMIEDHSEVPTICQHPTLRALIGNARPRKLRSGCPEAVLPSRIGERMHRLFN